MRTATEGRNQHRGVVLALHHAASIHRMLEFYLHDRHFDDPITALEVKRDAEEGMASLEQKLLRQFGH